ncbi:MAG: hypothetical protein MMC23_005408 [Stictis urceolatum]|nr:hypothetical protein [Stictis urceolata]
MLKDRLEKYFPALRLAPKSLGVLTETIVAPSIALCNLVKKTSPGLYFFSDLLKSFHHDEEITSQYFDKLVLKDVKSRKTISEQMWSKHNHSNQVGKLVAVIEPSLWRQGDTDKLVRKAVAVMEQFEP